MSHVPHMNESCPTFPITLLCQTPFPITHHDLALPRFAGPGFRRQSPRNVHAKHAHTHTHANVHAKHAHTHTHTHTNVHAKHAHVI